MSTTTQNLSEQELIRRDKLKQLQELGIDPYPAAEYPVNAVSTDIKARFSEETKEQFRDICLAGRVMAVRDMGKACFVKIQDGSGQIQAYIRRDDICPGEDKNLYDVVFKKLTDIGDIVGLKGYGFVTKTGETSIHVREFVMLSKALRPLPIVKEKDGETFDAVTDIEFKYRQRYADMIINPQVKEVFVKRTKLMQTIRNYYNEMGFRKWKRRSCSRSPAARQHVRSLPITTRWICHCTCALPTSCT
ncbi:OB-fold nucleic acid binding domain-containing protein [Chitinophaga sedimenti]|uniref:OB-fold nucleic acid binding domain-containing protein n=1 Tax=Chitinophaga sedimenti TaxID=2033606 RepID=UPI002002A6A8|nr:OB-fold nucleic acid binding domain-containing protein [Chitinophaga sedimenti]MCK7558269.1 OB-fold nucleic acid binding domain-containing protein [Chitinophaga sedimenti]